MATIIGNGLKDLVDITLTASVQSDVNRVEKITATAGHRLYLPVARTWVDAGSLKAGDQLSRNGSVDGAKVSAIRRYSAPATVYNLTVRGIHTYHVGALDSLAHNCKRAGMDFTDSEREAVYARNLTANGDLTCEYCGRQVVRRPSEKGVPGRPDDAQIDHIEAKANGGHGGAHNGAVTCRRCNRDKSTKSMSEWDGELSAWLD